MRILPYKIYKNPGVLWIDKIPEHWEIKKLKYLLESKITDGPHETPTFIDEGVPFLSVDSIQNGKLFFENCRYISKEDHAVYIKKCKPERSDILLGKAASIGKIAIVDVDFEFSIWSPLALIKPDKRKIRSKFLEYSLKSNYAQDQISVFSTLNTQQNISMDDIARLVIIIPPIEEQDKIINFLDEKNAFVDYLLEKIGLTNPQMEEFRQVLISSVVTGKIRV